MKVDILGVKVDKVNMDEAVGQVQQWIWNPGKHYIVTPNPEMVVAAQRDLEFKKALNDADLSIPDGMGLKLSGKIKNTFAGTDFMEKLISLAAEKGFTTGFLGGKGEVAVKTAERLKKKYPGLKVVFAKNGGEVDNNGNVIARNTFASLSVNSVTRQSTTEDRHGRLGDPAVTEPVDLLFVAFGHIKQEKWMAGNLDKLPVHVSMGVGGAFDYLSGSVPRAPGWMRNAGFEWLFRLIVQPWRIKRQLVLIKYLWLLLLSS